MIGLPYCEITMTISEAIFIQYWNVMDRQTDRRQTDRFAISISRVSVLTRDKNSSVSFAKSGRSCKFNREALKLNNKIK